MVLGPSGPGRVGRRLVFILPSKKLVQPQTRGYAPIGGFTTKLRDVAKPYVAREGVGLFRPDRFRLVNPFFALSAWPASTAWKAFRAEFGHAKISFRAKFLLCLLRQILVEGQKGRAQRSRKKQVASIVRRKPGFQRKPKHFHVIHFGPMDIQS